jgi:hypothetical protein
MDSPFFPIDSNSNLRPASIAAMHLAGESAHHGETSAEAMAHADTVRILQGLHPMGVAMAGLVTFDPYKD